MDEMILLFEKILEFIKKLPLTDILVGVIVPITAAWISYYLAERAIRRKENNRLFIQIGLIKKELESNDKEITKFILLMKEKEDLEKALEFPLIFMKNFIINIIENLQDIKKNYMHSGEFVFEKPTKVYILAQEVKDIENKIRELECQYYSDEYLDEKRKEKLSKLIEQKVECIKQIKDLQNKDIYKEFANVQFRLEQLMVGDVFEKLDNTEVNFILAKYLYEKIKMFNQKSVKTKEDVLELYNDLIIFNIDSDIIRNDYFDQERYDLYYKTFERAEGINEQLYELYEHYYKWIAVKERISKYNFNFKSKRWEENASDFVIINDSKLYILLVEFFEGLEVFGERNDNEEIFVCCGIWHEKIEDILKKLGKHEEKLRRKCK